MSASTTGSTERPNVVDALSPPRRFRLRRTRRWTVGLGTVVVVALGWALPAAAHVTVSPDSLPKGTGDAILTFRVPNESQTAAVVGLRVLFPTDHPIAVISPQAGSGWSVATKTVRLNKPVVTDDGTFTSVVAEIDWSGGSIPVGQFGTFNVLGQGFPSDARQLVFKAVQLYGDGTSVAWIQVPGPAVPNPPHPAPTLQLTAGATASATTTSAPVAIATGSGSGGSNGLGIAALVVAGAAVVIAALGIWLSRPLGRRTPPD